MIVMVLKDSKKNQDYKAGQFHQATVYVYDKTVLCLRGALPDDGSINQIGHLEPKDNLHVLTSAEENDLFAAAEAAE